MEQHLVGDRPDNLGRVLGWHHHIVYPGLVDFVDSLRAGRDEGIRHLPGEGDTLYQRLVKPPDLEKIFQDAMSVLSAQANRALVEAIDLTNAHHLVTNVLRIRSTCVKQQC